MAQKSVEPVSEYIPSVVQLLKMTYDDACSRYVELFLEREGTDSQADRLSQQTLLVFLVDEMDIVPTNRQDTHYDTGEIVVVVVVVVAVAVAVAVAAAAAAEFLL